jgi:hypothetical protein
VPEVGRQRVRAVAWSFDLDRDGLLDAAVYVDGGWTLYEVRRACARRVGRPAGTLVRLADEVIGPEGWVDVETDTFEGFGHTRRAWAFRRDEYAEVLPDAGVR